MRRRGGLPGRRNQRYFKIRTQYLAYSVRPKLC
jgi:hypothetical protein